MPCLSLKCCSPIGDIKLIKSVLSLAVKLILCSVLFPVWLLSLRVKLPLPSEDVMSPQAKVPVAVIFPVTSIPAPTSRFPTTSTCPSEFIANSCSSSTDYIKEI